MLILPQLSYGFLDEGGNPYQSLSFDGSTDYLSMSNANWGSFNLTKFAIAGAFFTSDAAQDGVLQARYASSAARQWDILISSNRLRFSAYNVGASTSALFDSGVTLSNNTWYSYLIHFDSANATQADRVKVWINGAVDTPSSYEQWTDISVGVDAETIDSEIGSRQGGGLKFQGLIHQPTFFSGTLPTAASVFSGTSGKLKDLAGLTGAYSLIGAEVNAVADVIKSADWTNNGTVTTSSTVPT